MKKEHEEVEVEVQSKNSTQKNRGLGFAFLLIAVGILFLLNNFGFLSWSIWADLWRFWPLFLIFWGLQMIFGKSRLANVLLLIISTIVLGYFILNAIANNNPQFNEYLKQNFPIWQNLYHYNSPSINDDEDDSPILRPGLKRPPAAPSIDFGDDDQIPFELP